MKYSRALWGKIRHYLCVAGCLGLSACVAGPDFQRPEPPVTERYTRSDRVDGFDHHQEIPAQWWTAFGSASIDSLVTEALENSPALKADEATFSAALYRYEGATGSSQVPRLLAGGGASRQETNGAVMGIDGSERSFNLFQGLLSVGYTLDLSGGNKRKLEALAARAEHRRYQLEAARLTLAARVTATALQLGALNDRLRSKMAKIAMMEKRSTIATEAFRLGGVSRQELLLVESELSGLRAEDALLRKERDTTAHQLALLCGREPGSAELPELSLALFELPHTLPLRVPSELVRKRPDILASEELMHAANAEYGATVAASYPQITLSAESGSQSLTLASLFGSGAMVWNVAGQLSQSLFDSGQDDREQAALAAFDLASANYRQTVLEALTQVSDILAALGADTRELAELREAYAALQERRAIATAAYQLGGASSKDLIELAIEKESLNERLITSRASRLVDAALLFLAMGG